jgi:aminoglycoside N3'-acetyltransferase
MSAVILIPLVISATVGILGYLTYRLVIFDYLCNRSVNTTLRKYDIKKTQFQILKEYYENKGETVSEKVISQLAKKYRQKEPEQFLTMYDSIRDKSKTE